MNEPGPVSPGELLLKEFLERSEEHTSELQSPVRGHLVCRLLLEIGRSSCRERV